MPTKGLTSPEGLLMLCAAVALDLTGFVIFILGTWFGIDDYGILEIIGITIIGTWMFFRYGVMGGDAWGKVKEDREQMKEEWEGKVETPKAEAPKNASQKKEEGKPTPTKTTPPAKGRGAKEWMNPKQIVKDEAKKLAIKGLKRFGLNFLVELIPFLGGFWPGWTIIVWKEMKE